MNIELDNFLNLKGVGEMIAHASDQEQADFFNGLGDHWHSSMGGGSRSMQILYMSKKFKHSGEEFILELAEQIKYNRDTREQDK